MTKEDFLKLNLDEKLKFLSLEVDEVFIPEDWKNEIEELTKFFSVWTPYPIKMNDYTIIANPVLFINYHLEVVKANNGNKTFEPYLRRLQHLRRIVH